MSVVLSLQLVGSYNLNSVTEGKASVRYVTNLHRSKIKMKAGYDTALKL